jgi:hypothetical protein
MDALSGQPECLSWTAGSAGKSSSDRPAKGNRWMRRLLNQLTHAAVRKQDSYKQSVFNRLSIRLGYARQRLGKQSKQLGYDVHLIPVTPAALV